jgi:hypothetical protein
LDFYGKWAYLRGKKGIFSCLKSCGKSSIMAELKAIGGGFYITISEKMAN